MADIHWHLGNKVKGSKDVDAALAESVSQVCIKGHESQFIRAATFSKLDDLLLGGH